MTTTYPVFSSPKKIVYGRGSFEKVGAEAMLLGKKALVVSDRIMEELGYLHRCAAYLHNDGVEAIMYTGVETEPNDEYVSAALSLFKKEGCDLIISVGGGSCLDTAKAVAVLATNGGHIGEYRGVMKMAAHPAIAHIAIPTTAGTGAEATDVTVIINHLTQEKMMIKQPAFMPVIAIVDSALTVSSPKGVTAATGVDALTHAIEAYLSRKAHAITDTLALSAMRLIIPNLKKAYTNGNDMEARDAMALGSLQAGMAFTNASVGLVHGMSRPIGALFHVPHGISNAILLPAVLEFSLPACETRIADIGRLFLQETNASLTTTAAAKLAIQEIRKLCVELNIPNLQQYGIDGDKFESLLTRMADDALKSGSPANNPRVPTAQEIVELYKTCYQYDFTSTMHIQMNGVAG